MFGTDSVAWRSSGLFGPVTGSPDSIPAAMQLRYLQTLTEIGAEQNSTVIPAGVFPGLRDAIKPLSSTPSS